MPRSAQIAAALTVRGSSPSGSTTRFTGFTRQLGQLVAERRRKTAGYAPEVAVSDSIRSVNVVRDVFLNSRYAHEVINRDFQIEALQAQRSLRCWCSP